MQTLSYSKNPAHRTCNSELSLFMFVCEVIPVTRVPVLNKGSKMLRQVICENLALQDYDKIATQRFVVKIATTRAFDAH